MRDYTGYCNVLSRSEWTYKLETRNSKPEMPRLPGVLVLKGTMFSMVSHRRRALLATPLLWATLPALAETPKNTIVMAKRIDDIISLDPAESFEYSGSEISGNIYEKLVSPAAADPTKIEPQLATSWTNSADGLTWTFTLADRRFASGAPVTAEDAAWSLQRAVILNKAPGFIISQFGFTPANVMERIRATDPHTLVIQIAEREAPTFLLYCLSANVGGVVEKAVAMAHATDNDLGNTWLRTNSAGSGAWVLRTARASELVALDANPNHPSPPLARRMIIRHVADPSVQLLLLQQGDADIVRDLLPEGIKTARANPAFEVIGVSKASLMHLSMNVRTPSLSHPEVREALRWAIDYQAIATNLTPETFDVHQAFLPTGFPAAVTDNPYHYDPARARALLAQAGFPGGIDLQFDHASSSPRAEIAQALQAQMHEAGIRLTLLAGEGRQILTKIRARQHQLAISLWGSDYFDPHSNAQTFCVNEDNSDASTNRTTAWNQAWADPDLSARALAAVREQDAGRRVGLYEALQRDVMIRGPYAIMLQETSVAVLRRPVHGLELGPLSDRTVYGPIGKG